MKLDPTVRSALFTLVDILADIPVTAPVKSPVFADIINLPIELPSNIVLEVGVIPDVFAIKPPVENVVLFTEEFTVLFPTETKTVVIFTLDPTLAPVLKLAMLVDNTEELT